MSEESISGYEPDDILAVLEPRGKEGLIALRADGYWYGTSGLSAETRIANSTACWKHWTPGKGSAAIWSCETVIKHVPGKIHSFFAPADLGDPIEGSTKTP